MSDHRQDPIFRAFVAGFCISREGFNGECDFDHQAPATFGEDLPGDGTFDAAVEYYSGSKEFMRLYGEYVAYKMEER